MHVSLSEVVLSSFSSLPLGPNVVRWNVLRARYVEYPFHTKFRSNVMAVGNDAL